MIQSHMYRDIEWNDRKGVLDIKPADSERPSITIHSKQVMIWGEGHLMKFEGGGGENCNHSYWMYGFLMLYFCWRGFEWYRYVPKYIPRKMEVYTPGG